MLQFLNDDVRLRYHTLSLEQQQEWEAMALALRHTGQRITVLYVDNETGTSEVSVRIDEQLD